MVINKRTMAVFSQIERCQIVPAVDTARRVGHIVLWQDSLFLSTMYLTVPRYLSNYEDCGTVL